LNGGNEIEQLQRNIGLRNVAHAVDAMDTKHATGAMQTDEQMQGTRCNGHN